MNLTLIKTGLRDSLRRPWLTALLVLSVAIGVAVVVAIDMANESASRAFNLSTEAVVGRATHEIVGGPAGIDDTVYRDLRVTYAYRLSAPIVEGYAGALEQNAVEFLPAYLEGLRSRDFPDDGKVDAPAAVAIVGEQARPPLFRKSGSGHSLTHAEGGEGVVGRGQ